MSWLHSFVSNFLVRILNLRSTMWIVIPTIQKVTSTSSVLKNDKNNMKDELTTNKWTAPSDVCSWTEPTDANLQIKDHSLSLLFRGSMENAKLELFLLTVPFIMITMNGKETNMMEACHLWNCPSSSLHHPSHEDYAMHVLKLFSFPSQMCVPSY